MNTNALLNRSEEVQKAKDDSERSDLKQHADKMLRDFEKFNDFSSNRAIWELVQNACDLTVNCDVTIDYRNGTFAFSHNGRAFNSNSLISLIKQVSGDKDEASEIPPVGKYGTGFLTTHSLGRKFIINSVLQSSSGHFIEIKDFLVDRSAKKWEDLSEQIRRQKDLVFEIIDRTGVIVDNPAPITTFTYLPESEQEIKYVADSHRDLGEYIPLVLTINNRLKSVKLISPNGDLTEFTLSSKVEIPNDSNLRLFKTSIKINDDERVIYSVADAGDEIEIILPINKNLELFEFPECIARLFLYYPLIGSEDFGMNFIINCNKFMPVELRNTIHLKSDKDQVKDDEAKNRVLLEKASELLFRFLDCKLLRPSNPLLYANINFKRKSGNLLLDEYFTELQKKWVDHFENLDIVETNNGYKKVYEVTFLNPKLLEKEEYFESVYYLLDKFYEDIPSKQTIKYWSRYVYEWGYDETSFITNESIVEEIENCSLKDFDSKLLKTYYQYLLDEKHTDLFAKNKLLPNINGEFQYLNILKEAKDLDENLINIGRTLIPEAISQLADKDFSFEFKFDTYSRKDFSNSVNATLGTELTDNSISLPENYNPDEFIADFESNGTNVKREYFLELLNYCKLHNNTNSQSKPTKLMGLISDYYRVDKSLIQIAQVAKTEDDIDIRPAQKSIAKTFFNTLGGQTANWVENNLQLLFEIAQCNEDRFKDVYSTTKIFPNQLYKLCVLSDLKKAVNFDPDEPDKPIDLDEYLKDLYNRASRKTVEWTLADISFNEFLIENETVTNKTLSTAIEEFFFETDMRDINAHSFKEDILFIIPKLNTVYHKELFPRLDDKKANLMLEVVTNENIKDDIFSIVSLKEEQLKKLGKILQLPNFEEILTQAEDAVRLAQEKDSDFRHKHEIGTYVEDKIREKLGSVLSAKIHVAKEKKIDTDDVQGGQDIIISYGETLLYYIEVKSRWNSKNSISMSKLQLEKSSENIDKYSLIAVDITKYQGTNNRYKLPLEEIVPLVKVIDNIGKNVQPLITNNLIAERDQSSAVTLVDYRGLINQDFVNTGQRFYDFVDKLVDFIQSKLSVE